MVLCHGLTSSPASLADWAQAFGAAGFTVRVPRLPGHGTSWQQLNRTSWPDWYRAVERALLDLSDTGPVMVGGLSMGAALALRSALEHPGRVAGLMLVNPCVRLTDPRLRFLPLLKRVRGSIAAIAGDIARPGAVEDAYPRTPLRALASSLDLFDDVAGRLEQVRTPVLVAHSAQDHVVPVQNAAEVLTRVSSPTRVDLPLQNSFHVATLDVDAPLLFERSVRFARQVLADQAVGTS